MHWSNLLLVLLRAHRPLHEALEVLDDWHNVTRVVRDPWEVAAERIRVGLGKVERARGGRKGAGGKKGKKKKGQGQGKKGAGKRSRAEVEGEAKSGRKKEAGGALAERGGPARNWKGRVAVVYLCCKGKQDVVHMQTSLRLLHRHFLARFPYPVRTSAAPTLNCTPHTFCPVLPPSFHTFYTLAISHFLAFRVQCPCRESDSRARFVRRLGAGVHTARWARAAAREASNAQRCARCWRLE